MNKIIYSILSILIFSLCINAQDSLVFDFDNGINVAFKSKTVPPASKDELQKQYQESGSFNPKDISSIMRTYTNDDEKIMFAYGMDIKQNDDGKTFTVTFKPRKGFKVQSEDKKYDNLEYVDKNLPNYPANIVVNDGDTIVLDVLENPKTGAKIQDLIKITREKRPFRDYFSELVEPKDFTIDDIQLQLANYKVFINGQLIKRDSPDSGRTKILGLEFNKYGYIYLTATPEEGFGFKQGGVIDGNKMKFEVAGDKFEITSETPILGLGKKWNLYIMTKPREKNAYVIPERIGFVAMQTNRMKVNSEPSNKNKVKPVMIFNMSDLPKPKEN